MPNSVSERRYWDVIYTSCTPSVIQKSAAVRILSRCLGCLRLLSVAFGLTSLRLGFLLLTIKHPTVTLVDPFKHLVDALNDSITH